MVEARTDVPAPEEKAVPRFTNWGVDVLARRPYPKPELAPTAKTNES